MSLAITEDLTEEQKQIKKLVKEFYQKEVDVKRVDEISLKATNAKSVEELRAMQPLDLIEKLFKLGLRQLGIPAKYGGTAPKKGVNVTLAVAAEEAGYWGGPNGAGLLTQSWHYLELATSHAVTEEQKKWFFSQYMANPTMQLGATVSEPSGMTDILLPYDKPGASMKTIAHKEGKEWVINGDKMFSSDAGTADFWKVGARTKKDGPVTQSSTFFWVKRGTPGVTMIPNKIVWVSDMGNVQTFYDNVRVPEEHVIGKVNEGLEVARGVFETKWVHWASFLGAMQRLYDHMRDYAKQRVQGAKPIIQHPNVAYLLGEAAIDIEALRALIYKTARITDGYHDAGKRVEDLFWSEAVFNLWKRSSWRLCEIATDVYGGLAGSADMPLEAYVRTVLSLRAGGATTMINAIKCSMEYNKHPLAMQTEY